MPFYTQSQNNDVVISGQAVDVIASFKPDGEIMPLYVGVSDIYGDFVTTKIEYVRRKSTMTWGMSFNCVYQFGETLKEVELRYHFNTHSWMIT